MPPPLSLTDEEMSLLRELSAPIDHHLRPEFLAAVAAELEASGGGGPGLVHCVAAQVQRRFFGSRRSSARANTDAPKGGGHGVSGSGRAPSGRASRYGSVADPSGRASSGAIARLGGRR